MYDELARIERQYGCVPEYNRCMEEESQHRYALENYRKACRNPNMVQLTDEQAYGKNQCHKCKKARYTENSKHDQIWFCSSPRCKRNKVEG